MGSDRLVMWDEIKKEFYAVFGGPVSMQLFNNTEACEAITKYRSGSGYGYLVSFISLLNNEDFKQFSRSDINIIGYIYKDSVVDFQFVDSSYLIDNKYKSLYPFALPFTGLIGKEVHPFTVEVISKQPLCSPELIHCICKEKNIKAAAAVIFSIAEGFKCLKKECDVSCFEVINYLNLIKANSLSCTTMCLVEKNQNNFDDAIKMLIATFSLKKILEIIKEALYEDEDVIQLVSQIWDRLIYICDTSKKTPCYRKADFVKIINVDRKYFSDPDNKWCKLWESNKVKPLETCAEIEYEGKLFQYVKEFWDSKINKNVKMNGLIKTVPDLKELFKIGYHQFITKRTESPVTKTLKA